MQEAKDSRASECRLPARFEGGCKLEMQRIPGLNARRRILENNTGLLRIDVHASRRGRRGAMVAIGRQVAQAQKGVRQIGAWRN